MIDHLKEFCEDSINSNLGLAYFYFNYKSPSTVLGLALALLEQLYIQSTLATEVQELEMLAERKKEMDISDVVPVLLSLCSRFRRTYVIIDALDECLASHQGDLEQLLTSLIASRCRILVFSRPNPILKVVERYPHIEIRPTENDIRTFTTAQIARSSRLKRLSQDDKDRIVEVLSREGSNHGMYVQRYRLSH